MPKITLNIPDEMLTQLRQLSEKSGFASLDDFLLSLLQKALEEGMGSQNDVNAEEEIRKRLENLGYM
jgi:Arc/MetJ-type ribon-helix-helix transcriptional regulator